MANKQKILIVDDDENIANLISLYLTKECYETRIEHDGQSALDAFKEYAPNLILLDIMLPGLDGYEVCREIRRESKVPIIMLSAKTEVFDKVLGLELGADDYIIKPFDSKELVARVKAVLRRYTEAPAPVAKKPDEKRVEYKDLIINLSNYEVIYKGKPVEIGRRFESVSAHHSVSCIASFGPGEGYCSNRHATQTECCLLSRDIEKPYMKSSRIKAYTGA